MTNSSSKHYAKQEIIVTIAKFIKLGWQKALFKLQAVSFFAKRLVGLNLSLLLLLLLCQPLLALSQTPPLKKIQDYQKQELIYISLDDANRLAPDLYKDVYVINYFQANRACQINDYGAYTEISELDPNLSIKTRAITALELANLEAAKSKPAQPQEEIPAPTSISETTVKSNEKTSATSKSPKRDSTRKGASKGASKEVGKETALKVSSLKLQAHQNGFYQGKLKNVYLPYQITYTYTLNGQPISAKELAGKNGKFKLAITISPSPNCDPSFAKSYLCQLNFALPLNNFSQISAPQAQQSLGAGNTNLSYIVLPNQSASFEIQAQVKNCQIPSSMFYALPISYNFEPAPFLAKNGSELQKLSSGVQQLNAASNSLKNGFNDLANGLNKLANGSVELASSGDKLAAGANDLQIGITQFTGGLNSYVAGVEQVANGLITLNSQAQVAFAKMEEQLKDLPTLTANLAKLEKLINAYDPLIKQLLEQQDLLKLLNQFDSKDLITKLQALEAALKEWQDFAAAYTHQSELLQALAALPAPDFSKITTLNLPTFPDLNNLKAQIRQTFLATFDLNQSELSPDQASEIRNLAETALDNALANLPDLSAISDTYQQKVTTWLSSVSNLEQAYLDWQSKVQNLLASQPTFDQNKLQTLQTQLNLSISQIQALLPLLSELETFLATANHVIPQNLQPEQLIHFYSEFKQKFMEFQTSLEKLPRLYADQADQPSLKTALAMLAKGGSSLKEHSGELNAASFALEAGCNQLSSGINAYVKGANALATGSQKLATGAYTYQQALAAYQEGMQALNQGVSGLDNKIKAKLEAAVADLLGQNFQAHSFVSPYNLGEVASQFVFVYPGVSIETPQKVPNKAAKTPSFWEKLQALFK